MKMPTLRDSFDFLLTEGPSLFPKTESLLYVGHRHDTDRWWHQKFAPVIGVTRIAVVDIDYQNLQTAAEITPELYHGDIRTLQLPWFDLVFWDEGPEHLPREESLDICGRLMESNGKLLISCPWGFQSQGSDSNDPEFHHWGPMPEDFASIGMDTRTFGRMFVQRNGRTEEHGNLIAWGSAYLSLCRTVFQ